MVDEKYKAYAERIIAGEVTACLHIKKNAERYLSLFEREDIYFDAKKVEHIITFIGLLKHYTGKHAGKHFHLEDWQLLAIYQIFGFRWKCDDTRICRNVYIEIARKAGKSFFIAAVVLYLTIADGEQGAECLIAANSKEQARIIFKMTKELCKGIDGKGKILKPYRDHIEHPPTKSMLKVLASDADKLDGYNASVGALDELHSAPDDSVYSVIQSSMGMRQQPLMITVTTAGFNSHGFCKKLRDTYLEVTYGVKSDDSVVCMVFTLDDGDDYKDENNWTKCNPNIGVTVSYAYIRNQVRKVENNPSELVPVLTKNFNLWSDTQITWIPTERILKNSRKVSWSEFSGREVYVGLDLSTVSDLSSASFMTMVDRRMIFKTKYYLPKDTLHNATNINTYLYKIWEKSGDLTITPGNVIDYDYILRDILDISQMAEIQSIAYDSWNATQFNVQAQSEGLPMVEFSQSIGNFNRPTKEFERLILSDKVVLDSNEVTVFCFSNVSMKIDMHGNTKPSKDSKDKKIDGVIAKIQALGAYICGNVYDNTVV